MLLKLVRQGKKYSTIARVLHRSISACRSRTCYLKAKKVSVRKVTLAKCKSKIDDFLLLRSSGKIQLCSTQDELNRCLNVDRTAVPYKKMLVTTRVEVL